MGFDITSRASERVGRLAQIAPQDAVAGTYVSGWFTMADFERILAVVALGALGSSATVNALLQQATSSGGAGAKNITNKAIAQLSQSPTDESNSTYQIDCDASELDVNNGFTWVQLSITVAVATSFIQGEVWGFDPKFTPTSSFDLVSVLGTAN